MNSAMNSVPEIVGGGLSPPAAADRADGGGQYCQVPRHVRRQGRGGAARGHAAAAGRRSFEARVCVSLLCVSLLCVSASACLSGQGSSLCVSCVVSCVRCELLAVRAQEPPRAPNQRSTLGTRSARASRNLDFGFEVRGERGRRVCRTSCVRVWSHAVQRVFCVFCVFCVSP